MGSPYDPLLADIFTTKLETKKLHRTIGQFGHYFHYVRNIFCITDKQTELDTTTDEFNVAT